MIIVPSLDVMHPDQEHVFIPAISLILLCIPAASVFFSFSISPHFPFSHPSCACPHLILMVLSGLLYSALCLWSICCLSFNRSKFSFAIHFFLTCFPFFGMIYFADVTSASFRMFHLDSLSLSRSSNLFLIAAAYACLRVASLSTFSYCSFGMALCFFNFCNLTVRDGHSHSQRLDICLWVQNCISTSFVDGHIVYLIFGISPTGLFPSPQASWMFFKPDVGYYLSIRCASLSPFFPTFVAWPTSLLTNHYSNPVHCQPLHWSPP